MSNILTHIASQQLSSSATKIPATLLNQHCRATTPDAEDTYWWCCHACTSSDKRRAEQAQLWQPSVIPAAADDPAGEVAQWQAMLGLLLSLPPGGSLQLAVLRCGVRYAQRVQGYLHALSAADKERPPLLQGPLISWDEAAIANASADELEIAFNSLIDYLRSHNPLVQRYLTMAERDWPLTADGDEEQQQPQPQVGKRLQPLPIWRWAWHAVLTTLALAWQCLSPLHSRCCVSFKMAPVLRLLVQ